MYCITPKQYFALEKRKKKPEINFIIKKVKSVKNNNAENS